MVGDINNIAPRRSTHQLQRRVARATLMFCALLGLFGVLAIGSLYGLLERTDTMLRRDVGHTHLAHQISMQALQCRRWEKGFLLSLADPVAKQRCLDNWLLCDRSLETLLNKLTRTALATEEREFVGACQRSRRNYRSVFLATVASIADGRTLTLAESARALALSNDSNRELTLTADTIVQFNAVELAEGVDRLTQQLRFTANTLCTVIVAVLLLVMVWKWWFQRTILKRIDRLRESMVHFAEGDMSQRAPESGDDELGLIATQFNRMARNLGSQHRQLIEALEAADAAGRVKNEFLSNISHELRTPLHGIISFARFGVDESATAERQVLADYYRTIDECGASLLTHVNDLLDLATLEAGRMKMNFRPHCLVDLIGLVTDEYHSFYSEHRLTVVFDAPLDGVEVCLDGDRIQQVLRQLLGNAAKFSPEGGEIRVSLLSDEDAVCVSIADHGPGVPPDELELIFDKFSQSSATNTGSGGTGLGLAICRQIITAHRGRIWATNSPAGGACFSFEIPRDLEPTTSEHESRLQVTH